MPDSTEPKPSPEPESLSPWSLVRQVVDRINVQAFLFAIVIVAILALVGGNIPAAYRTLIYVVVVAGLLIHFWQVAAPAWMAYQEKKRQAASSPQLTGAESAVSDEPSAISVGPPAPRQPGAPATLTDYLAWLAPRCNELRLRVIDPAYADERGRSLVTLDDVYTDLNTASRVPVDEGRAKARRRGEGPEGMERETRPLSALEAVSSRAERCVVLTGDPGSGKSTFLHRLAYCLAMSRLDPLRGGDWLARLAPWPFDFKAPVFVTLLNFAARGLPPSPRAEAKAAHLTGFIRDELARSELAGFADTLLAMLREPGGLLLLDGLDEVPEPGRQRAQIRQAVEDFAAAFPHCRIVVTCRDYAYDDPKAPWILSGFARHRLADFDPAQIETFIDRWIAASAAIENWDETTSQAKAAQFKREVQPPRSAAQLAPRPILLQLMATLFAKGGSLPDDRAELYADSVKLLLDHWQKAKVVYGPDGQPFVEGGILDTLGVKREQLEQALHNVAYQAHLRQAQSEERSLQQAAEIRQRDLKADLEAVLGRDAAPVVDYIQKRAGLLLGRGGDRYAFPHRTFQEYLAACHLTGLGDFYERLAGHVRQDSEWWREVFLLAALQSQKQAAVSLIDFTCPETCEPAKAAADRWRIAALAAQAAVEVGLPELTRRAQADPAGSAFYPRVQRALAGWLAALLETPGVPLGARERAAAGRSLALLGDPRPGVCDPLPLLVEAPAGQFLMGSAKKVVERWNKEAGGEYYNNEYPQHPVYLDGYYIARYPVTNAQYAAFVQATGHEAPQHWRGDAPPAEWLNHPVVYVSWDDAVAYCRWLTDRMQDARCEWQVWRDGSISNLQIPNLQSSNPPTCQLPTEAQWEKAARGDADAREWPWGDEWDPEKCNWGSSIGDTTPVGAYPAGASPCGALDMVGNVWEWCADVYDARAYAGRASGGPARNPTGPACPQSRRAAGDPRALRGGAFFDVRRFVRCAARDGLGPNLRLRYYGFRVVLVFPGHSGIG